MTTRLYYAIFLHSFTLEWLFFYAGHQGPVMARFCGVDKHFSYSALKDAFLLQRLFLEVEQKGWSWVDGFQHGRCTHLKRKSNSLNKCIYCCIVLSLIQLTFYCSQLMSDNYGRGQLLDGRSKKNWVRPCQQRVHEWEITVGIATMSV